MTKIDPIIAVMDVNKSSKWYQSVSDVKGLTEEMNLQY